MRILDLGCGRRKLPGSTGIDASTSSEADIIHDLNRFPYPFDDSEFDGIVCRHILEHLDDIPRVMRELHRILKPSGTLSIITPHFSCDNSYTDPTHKHHFSVRSFDYFIMGKRLAQDIYTEALFEEKISKLVFSDIYRRGAFNINMHRCLGLEWIVNRYPRLYEKYFAFIFPSNEIIKELEAIKGCCKKG
ncbi:MAG: class I SAM-dependent methyltransferase [Candidatus Methylomirabilis sp.]|nr:class I SAM-dependent methyltransferase [Deltaproteobacteria bacterium]